MKNVEGKVSVKMSCPVVQSVWLILTHRTHDHPYMQMFGLPDNVRSGRDFDPPKTRSNSGYPL